MLFYSFQCSILPFLLLNLFLSILFFDVIVDGIAFQNIILELLVKRKIIDFLMSIFYPETLVNSFISSDSSLGFSIHKIMSSTNKDTCTSSFQIDMPFTSFSCPIALARTSSTLLNRSNRKVIYVLFLMLGRSFSFLHYSV